MPELRQNFFTKEWVIIATEGSIANSLNRLDRATARNYRVCVMVCVITLISGTRGEAFHRRALRFHADVAVPFQHALADVSGNRHDG
jgi:hypothetical protein